jgi:hypothetical protein
MTDPPGNNLPGVCVESYSETNEVSLRDFEKRGGGVGGPID